MNPGCTRRAFLLRVLGLAGAGALAALGLAGGAARWTARAVSIPFKPFRRDRLRDPHDLAG